MVTRGHLKKVLKEEKKFFKRDDVNFIEVQAYDEISVARIYKDVVALEGMAPYFPDKFPKGRQCNKTYMFNIFNTLYPDKVKSMIEHANTQRYSIDEEKNKENAIEISETWKKELESMPFIS